MYNAIDLSSPRLTSYTVAPKNDLIASAIPKLLINFIIHHQYILTHNLCHTRRRPQWRFHYKTHPKPLGVDLTSSITRESLQPRQMPYYFQPTATHILLEQPSGPLTQLKIQLYIHNTTGSMTWPSVILIYIQLAVASI